MVTLEDAIEYISATDELAVLRKIRLEADKAIKRRRLPQATTYHFSPWALSAAQALWVAIQERYPFTAEPNLGQWADDIDKLQRLDNYKPELIQAVIRWSQQDQFWRQQVRSGANLRKHFVKMLIRIKEERSRQGAVTI